MLSRRALPTEVFDAARELLWRGAGLAEPLAARLEPATYQPWTYAPDFVSDESLGAIRSADREWESSPEGTWEAILDYVAHRMLDAGATWVVPDSMRRTSDPAFARHQGSNYFVVGETPYYVVREPDPSAIERAWNEAGSAAGELAILTLAEPSPRRAGAEPLATLVAAATDVVLEAYDNPRRAIFFSADPTTITSSSA